MTTNEAVEAIYRWRTNSFAKDWQVQLIKACNTMQQYQLDRMKKSYPKLVAAFVAWKQSSDECSYFRQAGVDPVRLMGKEKKPDHRRQHSSDRTHAS